MENKLIQILNDHNGEWNWAYSCEEFIEELEEEIALYGEDADCWVFTSPNKDLIFLTDYAMPKDLKDYGDDMVVGESMIRTTLKEALEAFKYQDSVIK